MRRLKSIALLLIMGMVLFPWHMVCAAHPMGHSEHNSNLPSSCELHRMASQQEGEHLLPPMECEHLAPMVGDFEQAQTDTIVPTVQMVVLLTVIFDLVPFENQEQPHLFPPDPNCRSATLISDKPLRGPPLA